MGWIVEGRGQGEEGGETWNDRGRVSRAINSMYIAW